MPSFPQNSTCFRNTSTTFIRYGVPQPSFFPMQPLTRTLTKPSSFIRFSVMLVLTSLQTGTLLMFRLKNFKWNDESTSNSISCVAFHQSPSFATHCIISSNSSTKLEILSFAPSLSSSMIVCVSTLRLGDPFSCLGTSFGSSPSSEESLLKTHFTVSPRFHSISCQRLFFFQYLNSYQARLKWGSNMNSEDEYIHQLLIVAIHS